MQLRYSGYLKLAGLSLIVFFLTVCGGSSGNYSSNVTPAIPFYGQIIPAVITGENAVKLSTGVYTGMGYDEKSNALSLLSTDSPYAKVSDQPQINTLLLSRIWEKSLSNYFELNSSGRASRLAQIDQRSNGTCDGYADMVGSIDGESGYFSVDIRYQDYSDDCVRYISGRTNDRGYMDVNTLDYYHKTVTYEALVFTIGTTSFTQSGTWFIDYRQYPNMETVDIVTRNDATGKTYWMNNYDIYLSNGSDGSSNYVELDITGRYFDPNYGYVDIVTEKNFRVRSDDYYPYEGVLILSGGSNTGCRFEIITSAVHRTTCDMDGDGQYDDFDSGLIHWTGENNPHDTFGFGAADRYSMLGNYIGTPTIGDFNGDGLNDVGVFIANTLLIYHQNLSGKLDSSFEITSNMGDIYDLDFGDVNSDGLIDLVLSGSIKVNTVWKGLIEIHYQDPITHELVPSSAITIQSGLGRDVNIADINSDGRDDILVATETPPSNYDKLSIFYQNIDGSISSESIYSYTSSFHFAGFLVDDMDDDGDVDIVVKSGPLQLSIIKQDSTSIPAILDSRFDTYDVIPNYWSNLGLFAVGDLNGNNKNDIIAMGGGNAAPFNIFYQNNYGTMNSAVVDKIPTYFVTPDAIGIVDINGDGLNDVVGSESGKVRVYYQKPDHTFGPYITYTYLPGYSGGRSRLSLGDVTGDGLPDAVATYLFGLFVLPNVGNFAP